MTFVQISVETNYFSGSCPKESKNVQIFIHWCIFSEVRLNMIFIFSQANGIKLGPQHSASNPGMPMGGGGAQRESGCC